MNDGSDRYRSQFVFVHVKSCEIKKFNDGGTKNPMCTFIFRRDWKGKVKGPCGESKIVADNRCGDHPLWLDKAREKRRNVGKLLGENDDPDGSKRLAKFYEEMPPSNADERTKFQEGKLQKAKILIESKGGEMASDFYVDHKTIIFYFCDKGHPTRATVAYIRQEKWCKDCPNKATEMAQLRFQDLLLEIGFKLMSEYLRVDGKVLVKCDHGVTFKTVPYDMMKRNHRCPCWKHQMFEDICLRIEGIIDARNGILDEPYINWRSPLTVTCGDCGNQWRPWAKHLYIGSWCPKCKRQSKGELAMIEVLGKMGITDYQTEFKIPLLGLKRYDFCIIYEGLSYIIEVDGLQHFVRSEFYHKTEEMWIYRRNVDKLKTLMAIYCGYCMIRIDFRNIENIEEHINNAINSENALYYSDPEMYRWIENDLSDDFINHHCTEEVDLQRLRTINLQY